MLLAVDVVQHDKQHWYTSNQESDEPVGGAGSLLKSGDTIFDLTEVAADRVCVFFDSV